MQKVRNKPKKFGWKKHLFYSLFVLLQFTYCICEHLPLPFLIAEVLAADSQVEELPLSLSPDQLVGKLRSPSGVWNRNNPHFINWEEGKRRKAHTCDWKGNNNNIYTHGSPSLQWFAELMEMLHSCVSKGNLWTSIWHVLNTLRFSSIDTVPS